MNKDISIETAVELWGWEPSTGEDPLSLLIAAEDAMLDDMADAKIEAVALAKRTME